MRAAPPPAIMLLLGALTLAAGGQWLRTDDAAARQGPGPTVRRAGRLPLLSYARRCSGATRTAIGCGAAALSDRSGAFRFR